MAFEDYIINNKFIFDYTIESLNGDNFNHLKINFFEFKIEFSIINLESFISFGIVDDKITYFNKLMKYNILFGKCDIVSTNVHNYILTKHKNVYEDLSYKDFPYNRINKILFENNILNYKNEILDYLFKELIDLNLSMKRNNNRFEYTKYRNCHTLYKKKLFDKLLMIDDNLKDKFDIMDVLE